MPPVSPTGAVLGNYSIDTRPDIEKKAELRRLKKQEGASPHKYDPNGFYGKTSTPKRFEIDAERQPKGYTGDFFGREGAGAPQRTPSGNIIYKRRSDPAISLVNVVRNNPGGVVPESFKYQETRRSRESRDSIDSFTHHASSRGSRHSLGAQRREESD